MNVSVGSLTAPEKTSLSVRYLQRRHSNTWCGRQSSARSGRLTLDNILSSQLPFNRAVRTQLMIPTDTKYLIAAIFLSPIFGVLLASFARDVFLLFKLDLNSWLHNVPTFVISGFATSILGLVISFPVVLFYGVPVFYLLRKIKRQTAWMFGLFGLLPASIGVIKILFEQNSTLENLYFYSILFYAFGGLFTAIFFWFIAVYIPSSRREQN